jgi:hypothetical protein
VDVCSAHGAFEVTPMSLDGIGVVDTGNPFLLAVVHAAQREAMLQAVIGIPFVCADRAALDYVPDQEGNRAFLPVVRSRTGNKPAGRRNATVGA